MEKSITNIEIAYENQILIERSFQCNSLKDKMIIKNLFTLTFTHIENTYFSTLVNNKKMQGHYGYTGIGVIEQELNGVGRFKTGSKVLIPGFYSKYIILTKEEILNIQDQILILTPDHLDPIKTLFFPFIAISSELYEELDLGKQVIFNSCHLIGFFLLQKLQKEEVEVTIYINESDIACKVLEKYGGKVIKGNLSEEKIKALNHSETQIINFSNTPLTQHILTIIRNQQIFFIDINNLIGTQYQEKIWQQKMVQEQILNESFLDDILVEDLITQHLHSESLIFMNQEIKSKKLHTKSYIYDW